MSLELLKTKLNTINSLILNGTIDKNLYVINELAICLKQVNKSIHFNQEVDGVMILKKLIEIDDILVSNYKKPKLLKLAFENFTQFEFKYSAPVPAGFAPSLNISDGDTFFILFFKADVYYLEESADSFFTKFFFTEVKNPISTFLKLNGMAFTVPPIVHLIKLATLGDPEYFYKLLPHIELGNIVDYETFLFCLYGGPSIIDPTPSMPHLFASMVIAGAHCTWPNYTEEELDEMDYFEREFAEKIPEASALMNEIRVELFKRCKEAQLFIKLTGLSESYAIRFITKSFSEKLFNHLALLPRNTLNALIKSAYKRFQKDEGMKDEIMGEIEMLCNSFQNLTLVQSPANEVLSKVEQDGFLPQLPLEAMEYTGCYYKYSEDGKSYLFNGVGYQKVNLSFNFINPLPRHLALVHNDPGNSSIMDRILNFQDYKLGINAPAFTIECALFDRESTVMKQLKHRALTETKGMFLQDKLKFVNAIINKMTEGHEEGLVERMYDYLLKKAIEQSKLSVSLNGVLIINTSIAHPITAEVTMEEMIENKLIVCRHRGLMAACIIGHMIKNGALPAGSARYYASKINNGYHAWAVYCEHETGSIWMIDPMWKKVINITKLFGAIADLETIVKDCDEKNEHTSLQYDDDLDCVSRQILQDYSVGALREMILRLKIEEAYGPMIRHFNENYNVYPLESPVQIMEAPYRHIRVELADTKVDNYAFMTALRLQGFVYNDPEFWKGQKSVAKNLDLKVFDDNARIYPFDGVQFMNDYQMIRNAIHKVATPAPVLLPQYKALIMKPKAATAMVELQNVKKVVHGNL